MADSSKIHTIEAKTYKVGMSIEARDQVSSLWPSAVKIAESGIYCEDAFLHPGKTIRQTT